MIDLSGFSSGKEINVNTNEKLKISVITPIYGGSYEMSHYAAEGFRLNGHNVNVIDNSYYKDELFLKAKNREAQSIFVERIMENVYTEVMKDKPDLVFAMAQAPMSAQVLKKIRDAGILTAFWFVEDFRTLTYWKNNFRDYDIFFVIQDGPFVSKINSSGGNAYYLPVAAQFPSGSAATGSIYRSSVSFAGAPYRNRIKILTSLADEGISIFGENWSDAASGALKNSVKIGARRVSTEELRAIYAMSGINLNIYSSIFCDGVEEHRDYVNPRTFEIPAVGGFQLCDMRKGIEKFFKPGTEIELFASIDELREKIRFFRKNSKTASKIAECGQRRVREEHTYGHRMNEALNIIKTGRPYVHTMQA